MFAFDGEGMSDVEEARLGAADASDVECDGTLNQVATSTQINSATASLSLWRGVDGLGSAWP